MLIKQSKKPTRSKFQRHVSILIWKSYLQRQRRWRWLLLETFFAAILFLLAVFSAKPVFLTPLSTEPRRPLNSSRIFATLHHKTLLGFAPNVQPYDAIMSRATVLLQKSIMSAPTENNLNFILYTSAKGVPIKNAVIWVIWSPKRYNIWKFSIRSTDRAKYKTTWTEPAYHNPHLRSGFLAVQLAVSQAIIEHMSGTPPEYSFSLVSMPISPLMLESLVRKSLARIMLCFTLALIPPVLETEALVVQESVNKFKRGLRIRNVEYSSMYIAWLVYAYLSAFPICLLASITLILMFRWIHLVYAFMVVFAYISIMIMLALIMAMFHSRPHIAGIWTTMFTLLQTYLAEMLVHHQYDTKHSALTFLLNIALPPLGLVHAFNEFALLQTGRGASSRSAGSHSMLFTVASWSLLIVLYFGILMLLQRTIGQERAIGGQVSWKSIIFKQAEDRNKLKTIVQPTGNERQKLQEVDELVAKAISFTNVSKSIMGEQVLSNVTMDIYRGEFTIIFAERVQNTMITTIEDLLSGVTYADTGKINVLGLHLKPGWNFMCLPHMMGYCHGAQFLVEDLTVQEHITLFTEICLWKESKQYINEYCILRSKTLLTECDLENVKHEYVRYLDLYYRAQLCWAIALLLEPRVIVMPNFTDVPKYIAVIKDKIMKYKRYTTIVKLSFSSLELEYADRVFLFDNKILVFGGTPAFMFFRYGREYRVRMTLRGDGTEGVEGVSELIQNSIASGATVRAHLGSLLILRLPTSPTEKVAALVKDYMDNATKYGITSLSISLPDSEEVCRRAINEARAATYETRGSYHMCKDSLLRIADPEPWHRTSPGLSCWAQLSSIGWKYLSFFMYYWVFFLFVLGAALSAGAVIGLSLTTILRYLDPSQITEDVLKGEIMTVESLEQKTTLAIKVDNSSEALSVANAYVLSEPFASKKDIKHMTYTSISHIESMTEYLASRAIDSPQHYVYMYAYGLAIGKSPNGTLHVQALYSPMHHDEAAAARSLARVHTALLRHYTGKLDASIQVVDDPLGLDLTPWMKYAAQPPLLIQFLLTLTSSYITLLPSMEHGFIRHTQSHALHFSPARYWLSLFFCDLVMYWMLVCIMTMVTVGMIYFSVPTGHMQYYDILVVPFMLVIYGFGCIPQAYIFSLGHRVALNTITFVIVNVIFGETTIIAKFFYGDALYYAWFLIHLSPQFNFAYAYVKVKQIFLYNSECVMFKTKDLCSANMLHKCCRKCGVLQSCFKKKSYLSKESGVMDEVLATVGTALILLSVLLLIEYRIFRRSWMYGIARWLVKTEEIKSSSLTPGVKREMQEVLDKEAQLKSHARPHKVDTFGECLLAKNLTLKHDREYVVRDVYLGLARGEALALSGLKRHGRLVLCELLAGYLLPSAGHAWARGRWRSDLHPHLYACHIALSSGNPMLPPWMTVYDALRLIGILRGVPHRTLKVMLDDYINTLELQELVTEPICRLLPNDRTRLHFAATVLGAPPVIIVDECTAYQKYSVRRAMYFILYYLKKQGHAIFMSSSSVESHMPVTNRLAIMVDGGIFDLETVDKFVERYSDKGYTVVVHLKDDVNVSQMFARHFINFIINDTSEVLANVQVLDQDLSWVTIFEKMEALKNANRQVYSYIVSAIPIDYIYNSIISNETGHKPVIEFITFKCCKKLFQAKKKIIPDKESLNKLLPFEKKYDITKLKELPWSVIFQR